MAEDSAHTPPMQPTTEPPSTVLHMLLKTVLEDARKRDMSGAVRVPAGLIVLLDMSLNAEKTMHYLEDAIDRLNASVEPKISASTNPILACLAELEKKVAGPLLNASKHAPKAVWQTPLPQRTRPECLSCL
ncbi:uncharacterized protein VP01_332g3, partial [Puccinia sorghi]